MNKSYGVPLTEWGKSCKSSMALKGISTKKLAEMLGLTYTYVSAIINGRIIPAPETVEKISEVLGISVADYSV